MRLLMIESSDVADTVEPSEYTVDSWVLPRYTLSLSEHL